MTQLLYAYLACGVLSFVVVVLLVCLVVLKRDYDKLFARLLKPECIPFATPSQAANGVALGESAYMDLDGPTIEREDETERLRRLMFEEFPELRYTFEGEEQSV